MEYPGDSLLKNMAINMSPWHINYCIHISLKHSYIFFENPRVACSYTKKVLQRFECYHTPMAIPSNTNDRDLSPFIQVFQLVANKWGSEQAEQQLLNVMTSPNIFRFTFVRNPFTRTLSCYLSKASPSSSAINKDIQLPKLGFPKGHEGITFREFLLAISKQKLLEMDIHWRPQFSQVFYDTIKYSFIGRYETFEEDFKKALKHIFPNISIEGSFLVDNSDTGNITNATNRLEEFYGPEEFKLVCSIYEKDFKIFNYQPELPHIK